MKAVSIFVCVVVAALLGGTIGMKATFYMLNDQDVKCAEKLLSTSKQPINYSTEKFTSVVNLLVPLSLSIRARCDQGNNLVCNQSNAIMEVLQTLASSVAPDSAAEEQNLNIILTELQNQLDLEIARQEKSK